MKMSVNIATYDPRPTPIHRVDARVKIILVVVFSIVLFCVHTWWALGVLCAGAVCIAACARIRSVQTMRSLLPIVFILVVTLLANSFVFDVTSYSAHILPGAASAGVFEDAPGYALIGNFGFVPAGFVRGCYYVLRIVLLVLASLILTTTTSSTEITLALRSFLRPLESIGLPTHDIATVVSIALRFIPVTIEEFQQIRGAQTARGAHFDTGGIFARIRVWASVLIPLFVGLFRRAENLALAMETRCYGSGKATQLVQSHITPAQGIFLLIAGISLVFLAFAG